MSVAEAADPEAPPAQRSPLGVGQLWSGVIWAAVGVLAVWAGIRGLGLDHWTPLAQLVSYTPYVAVLSALVLLVALASRRWRAAAVALVLAVLFGAFVLPRAIPGDEQDGERLRVMAFNTKIGAASPADLVALVRREQPDVLTVPELTPEWATRVEAAGLGEVLPYHALQPLPGASGTGIWARYPLTGMRAVGSPKGFDETFAVLRRPGRPPVEVIAAHPSPPVPRDPSRWLRDLNAEPRAPRSGPIRVLAGDFNASIDHSPFRRLLDSGYVDAAAEVGQGLTPTWPEDGQAFPPVSIDHVLVDERAGASAFRTYLIRGSDHRAIVADLVLTV